MVNIQAGMIYHSENFSVDTAAFALLRDGERQPIEPQVFDLLVYLIENRERVVTRDELLQNLWPGRIVSDSALNGRLKIARKAVGDDGKQQRIIKTVHRRGYRFVAGVSIAEPGEATAEYQAHQSAEIEDKPSIAMLPLEYQGDDASRQYIAAALTEEITTNLSHYRELFVVSHKSAAIYGAAETDLGPPASTLGVDYLARGQVRLFGDQIRISIKLIETTDDKLVWGERFDRTVDNLFTLEDEVASRIAMSLAKCIGDESIRRAARKSPENLTAYDCVMRALPGADSETRETNTAARELLMQAIALDPEYAAAHALLSHSYCAEGESSWGLSLDEAIARAEPHARRAVELDDFDADAHRGLAWVLMLQKKHDLAELHLDRAIECNPNDYDSFCMKGWFLVGSGRSDEAASCVSATMRLNPLAPDLCLEALMFAAYLDGRFQDALDIYPKIHEADSICEVLKAASLAKLGRLREAREAGARALELDFDGIRDPEWIDKWRLADARDIEHFLSGMYAAGVLIDPSQQSRKPSIVVLQFANLSQDADFEYFSEGMTINVLSALSRIRALKVMSGLHYDTANQSNQEISNAFGADYLLNGSVQREGERVRVFVELIEGRTNAVAWSHRYDRSGEGVMDIQDDTSSSIVATLSSMTGGIQVAEHDQLRTKPTRNFDAYDCVLRARSLKEKYTAPARAEAREWLDMAIELDSEYAEAYAYRAFAVMMAIHMGWTENGDGIEQALADARLAVELDPHSQAAHMALGWIYIARGDRQRGFAEFDRAMEINPNSSDLMVFKGEELAVAGLFDEGIELIERGIRFNVQPPDWYYWHLGIALFSAARLNEAIAAFERMDRQNRDTLIHLTACYALTGNPERAAERLAELQREDPRFSFDQLETIYKSYSDENRALMLRGIEIASGARPPDRDLKIIRA